MHLLLTDKTGRVVYSNLDPKCRECAKACDKESELVQTCGLPGKRRRGVSRSEFGAAFLCANNQDHVDSSKVFRAALKLYLSMLPRFLELQAELQGQMRKEIKRMIHNLTSLSAHISQELFAFVPQEQLATNMKSQHEMIAKALLEKSQLGASTFIRILKNASAMKHELVVLERVYGDEKAHTFSPKFHEIHRVFLNVASVFYSEFQEKGVSLDIQACTLSVFIDYPSFSVALYHLVQNAVKYTSHNSHIQCEFFVRNGEIVMKLSMESLQILPHEVERIFDDGYSGEVPRKLDKQGKGVGMGTARELVELNGGRLLAFPGGKTSGLAGAGYARNSFEIRFPEKPTASPYYKKYKK